MSSTSKTHNYSYWTSSQREIIERLFPLKLNEWYIILSSTIYFVPFGRTEVSFLKDKFPTADIILTGNKLGRTHLVIVYEEEGS